MGATGVPAATRLWDRAGRARWPGRRLSRQAPGPGRGGFEGTEGGASIVGEHEEAGALGEAVIGQEAIQGAIRDARDPGAELVVGLDQLAQLRNAPGWQFVDQLQQPGAQRRIVDPRRGGPRAVEQECARSALPIALQVAADGALPDAVPLLRRRIYVKAKAEPEWRFWGLYVHVCKMETLREAYALAKRNNGAPGIDGVTFAAIEAGGVESSLSSYVGYG